MSLIMSNNIVDLCSDAEDFTPVAYCVPSNVRYRQGDDGVVELLSDSGDDDDDDGPPQDAKLTRSVTLEPPYTNDKDEKQSNIHPQISHFSSAHQRFFVTNPYKQRLRTPLKNQRELKKPKMESKVKLELGLPVPANQTTSFDSEIEVLKANQLPATKTSTSGSGDDCDEDCIIVGQKGVNVLSDFPHPREDCVVHPMSKNPEAHCTNCFCYVCDVNVKDCKDWKVHCFAKFRDPFWKLERLKLMGDKLRRHPKSSAPIRQLRTGTRRRTVPATTCRITTSPQSQNASRFPPLASELIPTTNSTINGTSPKSPWSNTTTQIVGVTMTLEERQLFDAAKEARRSLYDPNLRNGARTSDLESQVTGPLSMYHLARHWCTSKRRNSSKIKALVYELEQVRMIEPEMRAVVFCQDTDWRSAITSALQKAKFRTRDELCYFVPSGASGEVWVQSTLQHAKDKYSNFSRVYFMELHINMAAETVALSRVVQTRGRILEVRKLVLTDTVEENIVDFQNALIRGDAKLKQDSSIVEVDAAGVAIILQGLT